MDIYQKQIEELMMNFDSWFNDPKRLEDGKMTSNLFPYKKLFEPIQINKLKIKNRIVMGPMGNVSMADETGKPSEKMIHYFIERAKGGVGLITSGMTPVHWKDDPSYEDLNSTGIFPRLDSHRSSYAGWRELIEGCHAYGSRFFIQLAPGMGRVGNPECLTKKKKLPISASCNPNWYIPEIPCRAITDMHCKRIIKHTGQIAADSKELGIDGVYLHGHSGYLIEQMTDPAYNRRRLGSYANWQNFGLDMVKEIRKRCGKFYPIHYRIDLSLVLNETYGERMKTNKILKKFNNGRTADMTLEYMKNLVEAGVDSFDVDLGGYENWWLPHPPNGMPPGLYIELAHMVKRYLKDKDIKSNVGLPVPIIAVGKLGYPDLAERTLRENKCDMIMLARPLLADPFWAKKVYSGRVDEIIPCIGDHEGCLGQLAIGGHPHCAVNPRTAFEHKYNNDLSPALISKKIGVIGAGPAGVIFACTAAKRGHYVTIYDKNNKAGGMLISGSTPKIKFDLINYINYLNSELKRTEKSYKLKTLFNTTVTEDTLKKENFDALILCTGSEPLKPHIEGITLPNVISGNQFLNNKSLVNNDREIVIIGGSDVGCEIAHMLSSEMNKKVTIVEITPYFMKKTCTSNRHYMIYNLHKNGVNLINCSTVKKINIDSIEISQNISNTVPDPYITWTPILPDNIVNPFKRKIKENNKLITINTDKVIICTGSQSKDDLYYKCTQNRIASEIYNIGDSFSTGRVLEAIKAAYALGNSI
ncbi:oxidoreductase [Oceanirhabdus sp. W0125-5]|uniref:oxidoreductase n=1 Tax=Oceanirhabdus sp. W0125-5 TaxID=2999116 RepID=UPI0022F2A54F|nr:FAD-dependent oxidoreductase [Oceanirhabdus sp. W0125-5]WBW94871.1 FAD-dependent oxidoreductase [Oceanirhabdus sp. W0125-5]